MTVPAPNIRVIRQDGQLFVHAGDFASYLDHCGRIMNRNIVQSNASENVKESCINVLNPFLDRLTGWLRR